MAQLRISNREDLEKWLQDQPREVAVAIAARAAMRVLPVLGTWLDKDEVNAISTILPTFHAISASLFAAEKNCNLNINFLQLIANGAAHAASQAAANKVRSAAFAIDSARAAVRLPVYSAEFSADFATDSVISAARSAFNASYLWKSVEFDARILTEKQDILISDFIYNESLWLNGPPKWAIRLWPSLKSRLLKRKNEHWEVWTNWYEARLDPSRRIPCYSPPIPELERKRVLLPEEVWEAGPARANAEIKRLIEEYGCEQGDDGPKPPKPLPGKDFEMDEEGRLHVVSSHPDEEEANDPVQQRMFARLKQKMAQLMSHMDAIGNQYPDLANVLRDYDEELSVVSLAEIDIPMVWMTGLGVVEQAEAFHRIGEDALTPRLEPEVEGLLREVAGLHGAFITGFRKGRELIARRMQGQFGPQAVERLHEAQLQFLNFALQLDASALTDRARAVFGKARDVLLLRGMRAEDKIGATLHVFVNSLIAVGKGLWPVIISGVPATAMGPEGVQAWLQFLQAHGGIIAAMAQTSPELRAYLRHLFDKAGIPWPDPDDDPQTG